MVQKMLIVVSKKSFFLILNFDYVQTTGKLKTFELK